MNEVTIKIHSIDRVNDTNPQGCFIDHLLNGDISICVGSVDYGGSFSLLSFFFDLFSMLHDCIFFGKHVTGGIIEEQRDLSLRPSPKKGIIYIATEFCGELCDEQEVYIDDFAFAIGNAYEDFVNKAVNLYPDNQEVLKLKNVPRFHF